ncbi:polyhydroxyalkanoic acid system family protein [Arenicella sp.]|nr:polyhydroxyalkanoic acid system family protein [Arenicella sp.]
MAKNLKICRQHDMSHDECREVAEQILEKLIDHFGGSVSHAGEDYQYKHPTGVKAVIEPGAKELNVNVKLGLLTSALAPKLEEEINRALDDHLGTNG